jgi:cytochrome P450
MRGGRTPDVTAEHRAYPYRRACPYDPPPDLARWHAESSVSRITLWNGRPTWIATGLDEARTVLRDHRVFSSNPKAPGYPSLSAADEASKESGLLPVTDPPLHDRLRRAVQGEFTVRRVNEKRVQTEEIVRVLLDRLADERPPVDLVRSFAAEVPARFTCRLLGVPLDDAQFFADCLSDRFDASAQHSSVHAADDRLAAYFDDVVQQRLGEPRDDLSGRLVRDHVANGELSERQAAALLHVLLIGGFDTTRNMIAMGTILLLELPDELARLQREPSRWPGAIEEMLRYLSVVQYERRAVTEDVELGGQSLKAGDGVLTVLHAANRDPRSFEHPDELDLDRPANNHVVFGSGIHQCLGQPLARMMLQVTYPRLFARFPSLRLVTPKEELRYHEGRTIWGPKELPVAW